MDCVDDAEATGNAGMLPMVGTAGMELPEALAPPESALATLLGSAMLDELAAVLLVLAVEPV